MGFTDSVKTLWLDAKLGTAGVVDATDHALGGSSHYAADIYVSATTPADGNADDAAKAQALDDKLSQVENSGGLVVAADQTAAQIQDFGKKALDAAENAGSWVKTVVIAAAVIVGGITLIYVIHSVKEAL